MSRRGLGRGLGALIPVGAEPPESHPAAVDIDRIVPNPYQPRRRIQAVELDELATSIGTYGLLQPLVVHRQGDQFQLIAGERRLQAAKKAGLRTVPVVIRQCAEREKLEIALVENLQREDINAMESADAYHRLTDEFGMTQEEIAQRVGKSRPAVANALRLRQLPEPIKESVREGGITEGHARAILGVENEETRIRLWQRVVKKDLSVRETERLASRLAQGRAQQEKRGSAQLEPNLQDVVDRLERRLGTRVRLHARRKGGSMEISYFSDDDLIRLVELLLED